MNPTARAALDCQAQAVESDAARYRGLQDTSQETADGWRAKAEEAETRAAEIRAALDGPRSMTEDQVIDELVAVMHKAWDGSPAVAGWNEEDWRRNAEFYLPVVHQAVARASTR